MTHKRQRPVKNFWVATLQLATKHMYSMCMFQIAGILLALCLFPAPIMRTAVYSSSLEESALSSAYSSSHSGCFRHFLMMCLVHFEIWLTTPSQAHNQMNVTPLVSWTSISCCICQVQPQRTTSQEFTS